MRFRRLHIPAYGPFTDFSAELPRGASDFHLVYGPNEAGKSSLLRAIKALLFGIHGQTADNFRHDYRALRIGAELEDAAGQARFFQRRKGNKDTLLDADGAALPDGELGRILGVVDEAYFDSMFGLDSTTLRHGADELLRGEGRLGEALFSASIGGTPVERVIQSLEEEAQRYYAGRARKSIRTHLAEYQNHQKSKKEVLVKPEAWEEVEAKLAASEETLGALAAKRRDLLERKAWLERCAGALPIVGQLAERRRRLADLPEFPGLAKDFAERLRSARAERDAAAREVERGESALARLESSEGDLSLRPEILDAATVIDRLHTGLGVYREWQSALAAKTGEAAAKEQAVRGRCRELGIDLPLDALESLRVTLPQSSEAEQAAARLEAARQALDAAERRCRELERELERLNAEAPRGDAARLALLGKLTHRAAALEPVAAGISGRESELARLDREMRSLHRQLPGAPEDLAAARELPTPARATLSEYRERLDTLHRQRDTLADQRREAESEASRLGLDIERLARQREIPSLADLEESRSRRERGWRLVLADWKGSGAEEPFVEGRPLEEAYPEAVAAADALADRLRVEAEAVAQLEDRRAQLAQAERLGEDLARREAEAAEALAELESAWLAAWEPCGFAPASPREMLDWRERWEEYGRLWDQWSHGQSQTAADRENVAAMAAELAAALDSDPSAGFAELLRQARERFEALDADRDHESARVAKRSETESELAALREDLPALREERAAAASDWERCREALSLPPVDAPAASIEALRERRELFRDFDAVQSLRQEVESLRKRIGSYERETAALAKELGFEAGSAELAESALWSGLEGAKKARTSLEGLRRQRSEQTEQLAADRDSLKRARARFDELFRQTDLEDESDLEPFLVRFEERWAHLEKAEELRDHLAGLARSQSVDDFVAQVEAEEHPKLEANLAEQSDAIREVETEIESARAGKQEWEGRRAEMEDARDEAARHEQESAFAASAMHADAERYLRLRVAVSLLRSQIDAFRERNQGPFMARASHWFAELTGGAFSGIGPRYADGDEPVIAGLRGTGPEAEEVLVEGMSEGTRDQLYLALRFAGLERHLEEGHDPMPMVLDDLLVHFDDERAVHALRALSKLGRASQVLLFTHHAHLVELADSQLGKEGWSLIEIEREGKPS